MASPKLSHLQKVLADASPDSFLQLQSFILKNRMANSTAIHAAVISSSQKAEETATLFCASALHRGDRGHAHVNSTADRLSSKRNFCSLNPRHPQLTRAPPSSSNTSSDSSRDPSGKTDVDGGVVKVTVPVLPLVNLLGRTEGQGGAISAVRLVTLDTDDTLDYQVTPVLHTMPCFVHLNCFCSI